MTAPDANTCTTLLHRREGTALGHGFVDLDRFYHGTLQSRLEYPLGTRTWTCDINHGTVWGCTSKGNWPGNGVVFLHVCESFTFRTTDPGGSGTWNCYVTHDALPMP